MSVDELVTDLITWARSRAGVSGGEPPVFRFERWIREDPERGWEVLQRLVARAPRDAEVMFQSAFRAPQLIHQDFPRYRDRVAGLLKESSYLDALLGPEVFVEADYGPRYSEPEQLAEIWLRYKRATVAFDWPEPLGRDDPNVRLRFALEVIGRGPLYGFDTDDVDGPLLGVVRRFGTLMMKDIEEAAQRSVAVRRAIWSVRHLNGEGEVSADLWTRFQAAAGETNACNSKLPAGEVHPLEPPHEELVEAWFAREATFWAWCEVDDLVRDEPEKGWRAVVAIVHGARSPNELGYCGAGPLEDLIGTHPAQFIDRVEDLARRDAAFREALASVWITLKDMPESLARRYFNASGRVLRVLDAPEGWARNEEGGER